MNVVEYFGYSSFPLYFLGGAIVFTAIVWMRINRTIAVQLAKTTAILANITTELHKDTCKLEEACNSLNDELDKTRKSTEGLHVTLRNYLDSLRAYFPWLIGDSK